MISYKQIEERFDASEGIKRECVDIYVSTLTEILTIPVDTLLEGSKVLVSHTAQIFVLDTNGIWWSFDKDHQSITGKYAKINLTVTGNHFHIDTDNTTYKGEYLRQGKESVIKIIPDAGYTVVGTPTYTGDITDFTFDSVTGKVTVTGNTLSTGRATINIVTAAQ